MSVLTAFVFAFAFSFMGTIPPGTLNLSVLQLGLEGKIKQAIRFSLAASLMEYPYCWLAIAFEELITSSPAVVSNFEKLGAIVMLVIGLLNFIALRKSSKAPNDTSVIKEAGFAKGLMLGLLNPLAMPYWIGITAYLKSQQWISLDSFASIQAYLAGVVLGAFAFFVLVTFAAQRIAVYLKGNTVIRYVPAAVLIVLGLYGLVSSFG
jgi:threonine/homoserine/homoserine lactone efflux protein